MIIEEQITNFKRNPGKSGPVTNPNSYSGELPHSNIYEKAVSQGYGDASRKINGIGKKLKTDRDRVLINISKKIKAYFESFKIISKTDYDNWHKDLCESIIKDFDNIVGLKDVSFGIAQKIVNMTFKYLRCFYAGTAPFEIEKFKYCHCPIDTIICKNIIIFSNNYNVSKDDYIALFKVRDSQNEKESDTTPWSKLDYDTYKKLQEIVNKVAKQILEYDEVKLNTFGLELEVSEAALSNTELLRQIEFFNINGISYLDIDILLWH